jgi:hypothetical protein
MPVWLLHFTFDLFFGAWMFMCGVGLASSIKRWLKGLKKPAKHGSQALGLAGGSHE